MTRSKIEALFIEFRQSLRGPDKLFHRGRMNIEGSDCFSVSYQISKETYIALVIFCNKDIALSFGVHYNHV